MHSYVHSLFGLLTFAFLFSAQTSISTAISLTWIIRADTSASTLENTCQCDCCYPVGSLDRTECVPPIDTSFDVSVCSMCDVDACAARFPVACAQPASIVNSECIARKGWMLRLVPIFFIIVSVSLLCYGFFFKRFDGYHDDNIQSNGPLLRDMSQPYNTFPQVYNHPMRSNTSAAVDKPSVRPSRLLPPILETEELSGSASPRSGVSTSVPSGNQTPHLSSEEQSDAPRTMETTLE